jgi:hypothetical protein
MPESTTVQAGGNAKKIFSVVVCAFIILCWAGLLIYILTSCATYRFQWDFLTYYSAYKAWAAGLDPYYNSNLLKFTPPFIVGLLPFFYPPCTLWFFGLFALDDYGEAAYFYLLVKLVLLAVLIYLWGRKFLREEADAFFYLYCLLAFNSAVYLDIQSGNITVFLQLFLWIGFFAFLKRRFLVFCTLIGIASLFKVPYLFLLCPLLFSSAKKKNLLSLGTVLSVLIVYAVTYLVNPELFLSFLFNFRYLAVKGAYENPSSMSLIQHIFDTLKYKGVMSPPAFVPVVVYIAIAFTVLLVTVRSLPRPGSPGRERFVLFLFCVAYALITPRIKDYSYMLLIVPSFFAIKRAVDVKAYPLFLIMFMLSAKYLELPVYRVVMGDVVWEYYPLFIAYATWLLLVCFVRQR